MIFKYTPWGITFSQLDAHQYYCYVAPILGDNILTNGGTLVHRGNQGYIYLREVTICSIIYEFCTASHIKLY